MKVYYKDGNVATKNLTPGISVYGEELIKEDDEYRVWNPFRSKLAAAILGGVDQIHMQPGSKVLYLGAASGTTVSHVADIVGPVSNHIKNVVQQALEPNLCTPC